MQTPTALLSVLIDVLIDAFDASVDTSKSAIFSPRWSQHEDDTMLVTNTIIPNPAWLFSETSFHTWTYTP
jgi:hypothetical protein